MRTRKTRVGTVVAAVAVALALLSSTACVPRVRWQPYSTHTIGLEYGAVRASLIIYRVPRKALYDLYRGFGNDPKVIRDAIWQVGKPPMPNYDVCIGDQCVPVSNFRQLLYDSMFGSWGKIYDLRDAVLAAQRDYNCLAWTFISYGVLTSNWTNKDVVCKLGILPKSGFGLEAPG